MCDNRRGAKKGMGKLFWFLQRASGYIEVQVSGMLGNLVADLEQKKIGIGMGFRCLQCCLICTIGKESSLLWIL